MIENNKTWKLTKGTTNQLASEKGYFDWIRAHLPVPTGVVKINFTAQENVPIYRVVTSTGFIANSATIGHRSKVIGITDMTTLNGFIGTAIPTGEIANMAWVWAVGDIIYLNGTTLSTIPPTTGFLQRIGIAVASTRIDIQITQSILL